MPVRRLLCFTLLLGGFTVGGCSSDPHLSTASVYADRPDATDRDLPRRELPIEGHRVPGAEPPPPPTGVLTIGDAITRAVTFNPSLKSAFLEIEAKHGEETQAAVKPNPELALELEDFGGNKATKGFQSAQETLQISQLIELGDKRIARLRSAHLDAAVAGWDYETARVQVITKAAELFVDALAAQERIKVLQNFVTVAEKTRNSVGARVDAGKASPIERDRSGVAVARAKSALRAEEVRQTTLRRRLSALWGAEHVDFTSVTGKMHASHAVPSVETVKAYLDRNPVVARWNDEIGRRYAILDVEHTKAVPDIRVGAGVRSLQESDSVAMVASVSMPLQIFDRNNGNIAAAERRVAKATHDEQNARTELTSSLYEALGALAVAAAQAKALENEVLPAAENAFNKTQLAYDEGKFDLLNVLDTQRTLFEVRLDLVNAHAEFLKAKVQVEALIGRQLEGL